MEALEHALALLFRRFRDPPVPEDDLVKAMSLTLNWTKPSNAKHLLDRGLAEGLIEDAGDGYAPAFDAGAVDVPFGFDPPEELFEPVPETEEPAPSETAPVEEEDETADGPAPGEDPVLEGLIRRIASRMEDGDRKRAVAAVNAKQEDLEGLVTLKAAALIVARSMGLDVREDAGRVLGELKEKRASA